VDPRSRLEILTDIFGLERDARNAVRATLDAAHKSAAPIRAELAKTRAALAAAAATGTPADLTAAARAYAEQSAAMTALEMKALAGLLEPMTPEQKKQGTAAAFYLMRGSFIDDRRWDVIPTGRSY
jgi:hypothetical protein